MTRKPSTPPASLVVIPREILSAPPFTGSAANFASECLACNPFSIVPLIVERMLVLR